jgi:hypothetical protein
MQSVSLENSHIGLCHAFEVQSPARLVALLVTNVMSRKLNRLVECTHTSEFVFVIESAVEFALTRLDTAELEPRVEGHGVADMELAASLEALDRNFDAIMNRSRWVVTFEVFVVFGWGNWSVGESRLPSGRFTLGRVSCCE